MLLATVHTMDFEQADEPLGQVSSETDLRHVSLRGLYGYWLDRARGRAMPDRADIDPLDMAPWLPNLLLADVIDDMTDIRFRVVGTWVVDLAGRDDTGKTFARLCVDQGWTQILDGYLTAARTGTPQRRCSRFYDRSGPRQHMHVERLLLPISRGPQGSAVLAAIFPLDE